jgi:hypothetical protein
VPRGLHPLRPNTVSGCTRASERVCFVAQAAPRAQWGGARARTWRCRPPGAAAASRAGAAASPVHPQPNRRVIDAPCPLVASHGASIGRITCATSASSCGGRAASSAAIPPSCTPPDSTAGSQARCPTAGGGRVSGACKWGAVGVEGLGRVIGARWAPGSLVAAGEWRARRHNKRPGNARIGAPPRTCITKRR